MFLLYVKCLWGNVQELALTHDYWENMEGRLHIRMCAALFFLKPDAFVDGSKFIRRLLVLRNIQSFSIILLKDGWKMTRFQWDCGAAIRGNAVQLTLFRAGTIKSTAYLETEPRNQVHSAVSEERSREFQLHAPKNWARPRWKQVKKCTQDGPRLMETVQKYEETSVIGACLKENRISRNSIDSIGHSWQGTKDMLIPQSMPQY